MVFKCLSGKILRELGILEAVARRNDMHEDQADEDGVDSIAIPRIGAGYGGLPWRMVRPIVETVFKDWPGTLYIYEEFVPDR